MRDKLNILNKNLLLENPSSVWTDNEEFRRFIELAYLPEVTHLHIDTESNGQNYKDGRGHTIGISIDYSLDRGRSGFSYYFPFRHQIGNLPLNYLEPIKKLIETGGKTLVAHNYRHDYRALRSLGIQPDMNWLCTMQMIHDVNENKLSYRLDSVTRELGLPGKVHDDHMERIKKLLGWDGIPPDLICDYAATDASLLRPLRAHYEPLWELEDSTDGERWEYDKKFMLLMNEIEETGIKVDLELAEREVERGEKRLQEITNELGLNPGSRNDLEELLINRLGLPVVKKSAKTQRPSFDKTAMKEYDRLLELEKSPVAKLVLEYRGYQKAVSSYWRAYLTHVSSDGRIRPNFNLHRTVTRRLSCDSPNGQQIPKVSDKPWNGHVKQGFVPEEGYGLWEADYRQLELRLSSAYAKEYKLIEVFADPSRDIFNEMAAQLGMERDPTKTLNYLLQFGGGVRHLAEVFGVSEQRARFIKDNYFNTYTGFQDKMRVAQKLAATRGYVRTWTGRRRHFEFPREEAHKAYNAVIQSGAADIVKRQMLRLREELDPEVRMVLQIHDSVVFEIPLGKEEKYGQQISRIMADVKPDFGVKFDIDFHKWGK